MALDILQSVDIIEALENYISLHRPEEKIRHLLDLSYKVEGQSVIIFEIRPHPVKPKLKIEPEFAKATWVHAKSH